MGALAPSAVLLLGLPDGAAPGTAGEKSWSELTPQSTTELKYAKQFKSEDCGDGLSRITIAQDRQYLLVQEGYRSRPGCPEEVTVLQQPIQNIYLTATASMDLFRGTGWAGCHPAVRHQREAAGICRRRQAMEAGDILYAGKYNAPDYELILAQKCGLAVESTMIYHNPEVKGAAGEPGHSGGWWITPS